MNPAFAVLALAPGLAFGSFLNVLIARVPLSKSVAVSRTCGSCSAPIAWYDSIPLYSYLTLRGRCRSCGTRIGPRYPVVEVGCAALVAACVLAFGLTFYAVIASFFCCVLVAISAVDLDHRIIPDRIVLPSTLLVLAAQTLRDPSLEWFLASVGAALFLFLAVLVYPAGMGMGDVKLALLMGAMLGKVVTVALVLGLVAGVIPSIYLLVRHGGKARKMGIPFAPFLALGSVMALFAGESLYHGYVSLLGA